MLKLVLPAGIAAEWLTGPTAHSFVALAATGLRALMFAAAAWLALEALAAAWKFVDSLDG